MSVKPTFLIVISIQNTQKMHVTMFQLSGANLFAGILFSGIGLAAFGYGKKQTSFKKMAIGGLLMFYPFLISNTVALYAIGTLLTIALFLFKD